MAGKTDREAASGDFTRIRIEREGGVAGPIRRPPVIIEISELNSTEYREIAALIESVLLDELPDRFPGEPYPDAMQTTLVVETSRRVFRVTFQDGDGHPGELDEIAGRVWAHRPRH